jgi:tetratricopeptide (TPR) repeat protein
MRRLAVALVLALACAVTDAPQLDTSSVQEPRLHPLTRAELPTTGGAIFVRNLEGELADAEADAREPDADADSFRALGITRYRMGRYRGDIDLVASAGHSFDVALTHDPERGDLYRLRAKVHGTLHRFADARADLDRASERGAPESTSPAMQHVDTARRAALRGDLRAAELAFTAAEDGIRDTDPMFLAWLYTQRGAALIASEPERAVEFLRAAVDRLPGFVLAEEHLAEALHAAGHDDEAIAAYETLVARTGDPEFMGALAEIHAEHGRMAASESLVERARARFDALLVRYPEAMAWHAAGFFAGPGRDPARACALLRANVALRPTPEALVALARAEWAAAGADMPAAVVTLSDP